MSQPKVYEYAKEVGLEALVLMDKIKKWKLPVKSHMSVLEANVLSKIEELLSQEKSGSTKKTKKTKKKVAKKSKAKKKAVATVKKKTKKITTKKITTKKTTIKKTTIKKAATKKKTTTTEEKKKVTVIRRRAKDVAAKEAAEVARAQAETQLAATAPEQEKEEPSSSFSSGRIVGRIDLGQVKNPQATPSTKTAARPLAGRGIRTGFIAPLPIHESAQQTKDNFLKEKKKKSTASKDQKPTNFASTEFRKREVIFQPKKKRIMTTTAKKTQITTPKASKRVLKIHDTITLQDLADQMKLKAPQIIKKLMADGVVAKMNTELDFDTASLIATEFSFETENTYSEISKKLENLAFGDLEAESVFRPPVVTIMGHVDHGKTTLLDAIRSADVVTKEAGGITQHIGAYRVHRGDQVATFIDTPGHEAFTAMRERGASVTDIVIIVVAADDGVMPQTKEAISHAKAAKVPIIVAMNKIDRPNANAERVKQQLSELELLPEDWGGTTIYSEVSALEKKGINELLDHILLVAEMQDLKANPKRSATGVVIESRMDKGRGCVATLLIKDGSIKVSDFLVAGSVSGKIRTLNNDKRERIESAGPGEPVEVLGFPSIPNAGERFDVCETEAIAEELAKQRRQENENASTSTSALSLEDIMAKAKEGSLQELSLVLKSDMAGSNEAIREMLSKLETDEVKIKTLHTGVGGISESDILLALTAEGLVIGFNVRPDAKAQRVAKEKGVEIKTYSVIYELIDDIKKAMSGLLSPDIIEESLGQAEVRELFNVPKVGTISGSSVTDGKITRNSLVRLVREGKIIYEGQLSSLKRFKDDAKEVQSGYECGIGIENYNDIKVGDVIEAFQKKEVKRTIDG